jgi:predicted thioesterase
MEQIPVGARADLPFTVAAEDTAISLGSGDVPVLATPRAIAWAEAACCAAVAEFLGEDETTVGTRVEVDHLLPTWVGAPVRADAMVREVHGRQLLFTVRLTGDDGRVLVAGSVTRAVIRRERFDRR